MATRYRDGLKQWHEVPVATLRAVLEAIGPVPEPVPELAQAPPQAPGVRLEAEPRCYLPPELAAGGRSWGWGVQLYALRSRASWGIGDLGDLAALLRTPDPPGFVLLNPLHAAPPEEASPYMPSSRSFRNPLYLRVEAVPEVEPLDADERAALAALATEGRALNHAAVIDRTAVWALKDEALRRCHAALERRPGRQAAFAAWRARTNGIEEFATFCGLQDAHGRDWRAWPAALHHPDAAAVRRWHEGHPQEVSYHAYLQWLLLEQFRALPRAQEPGSLGVVNDLAVGVAADGFDAWSTQDVLAQGVTIGAPPDVLGPKGQNWGLPAWSPARLAEAGYEPFARTLRANLEGAGGLRVDHVMGLFRLFLIPEGASPSDGTYVRYPTDDLLAVLAAESMRARALVVGEDLGTVAVGVRRRLAAARVLSYRLAWFEREPPAAWPRLALAAVTTHDLPTIAGRFTGDDAAQLRQLNVIPAEQASSARAGEARRNAALLARLEGEGLLAPGERSLGAIAQALHQLLAQTPCMLVAATLEDALLVPDRPNVPGTTSERPNWSLPLPLPLEELLADPRVRTLAGSLAKAVHRAAVPNSAEQGT